MTTCVFHDRVSCIHFLGLDIEPRVSVVLSLKSESLYQSQISRTALACEDGPRPHTRRSCVLCASRAQRDRRATLTGDCRRLNTTSRTTLLVGFPYQLPHIVHSLLSHYRVHGRIATGGPGCSIQSLRVLCSCRYKSMAMSACQWLIVSK
jgi:hypothetical protein